MRTKKTNGDEPGRAKQIGRYIVADPKICHGALTFRGTRILVGVVLEQVASGMTFERIVEDWRGSIPRQAVEEAVRLAGEAFLEHAAEFVPPAYGQRKAS
jgi:uncharacterized protein (DUF433 family)